VLLRAVSHRIRHLLDLLGLDAVLNIEPEPDGQRPQEHRPQG